MVTRLIPYAEDAARAALSNPVTRALASITGADGEDESGAGGTGPLVIVGVLVASAIAWVLTKG